MAEDEEGLCDGDDFALFLEAEVAADLDSEEASPPVKRRRIEEDSGQLAKIPVELFPKILKFLSAEDLSNCARACQYLRRVSSDEPLWKRLYCFRWGLPRTSKAAAWKQLYFERDRRDVSESLRNSPMEFKEYYLQMQTSKRSETPPAKATDDLYVVDQTITEQVNAWRRSRKLAENFVGSHTCSGQTCSYHQIGDVYICERTGCVHVCGDACHGSINDVNGLHVCQVSGRCFDDLFVEEEDEDEQEPQAVAIEEAEAFMGTGRLAKLYSLGYSCKDDREFEQAMRCSGLRRSHGVVYGN